MRKTLFAFTTVLSIICISISISYSEYYWAKTYGGTGTDVAESIIKTTDGGFLVSGIANHVGPGEFDWSITKVSSDGEIIWQKTFSGSIGSLWSQSLQQTTDGNYIVTGYTESFGAGETDAWILKFDSGGEILWQKAYGGSSNNVLRSIQQTADNGYITVGSNGDVLVMKLHSNGDIMWQKTYGANGGESGASILQTSDGGYIIAGGTSSFAIGDMDNTDTFVLKLNNAGDVSWVKTYNKGGWDSGYYIHEVQGEGYILGGETFSLDGWVYRLLKLDYSGNVVWDKRYGPADWGPYSFEHTSDGGYIICGGHAGPLGLVVKVDSSGNVEWNKTYDSQEYLTINSIRQTTDGSFMLAGFARFGPSEPGDALILKVDSDGDISGCNMIGIDDLFYSEETTTPEDVVFTAQSSTPTITDTTIVFQNTLVVTSDVCCYDDASDTDQDGIGDACDTCPLHPNSPLLGICFQGMWGKTCLSDEECSTGTLGRCSMDQTDNIRCDCKSNFDCDYDVDGSDAARFKADFGRSLFSNPCISQNPCDGDFECDGDVDGTDAADFKKYFGVTPFSGYCLACVDGVYQYDCSY